MSDIRIIGNDKSQNIDSYDPNPITDNNLSDRSIEASLPGASQENPNINWLGSSYAGADIKVLVHLYKTPTETQEEQTIATELKETQDVLTALEALLAAFNPLTALSSISSRSDDGQQYILNMAGTSIGTSASRIILPVWYGVSKTEAGLYKFRDTIKAFAEQYNQTFASLQDKQNLIVDIRNKSSTTVALGNLQTMSVQTYREKEAVRALGCSYVKGYCRGNRTIAGSMIFTIFNEHALAKLIRAMSGRGSIYGELDSNLSTYLADQLPPIDVTIAFSNEYGSLSKMSIYGLEFLSDGITMSVENLLTESVSQFVARDIDVMTSQGNIRLFGKQKGMQFLPSGQLADQRASDVIFTSNEAYASYLEKLGIRRRKSSI